MTKHTIKLWAKTVQSHRAVSHERLFSRSRTDEKEFCYWLNCRLFVVFFASKRSRKFLWNFFWSRNFCFKKEMKISGESLRTSIFGFPSRFATKFPTAQQIPKCLIKHSESPNLQAPSKYVDLYERSNVDLVRIYNKYHIREWPKVSWYQYETQLSELHTNLKSYKTKDNIFWRIGRTGAVADTKDRALRKYRSLRGGVGVGVVSDVNHSHWCAINVNSTHMLFQRRIPAKY